jgi:iron complex outermembrane receptor protein
MKIRLTVTALAVAAAFPASAQTGATEESTLSPVLVTATRIEMMDVDAPYASEVHSRADIDRSGVATLYDYLSRHTSITVLPSFGNRFTPKLDMRGYGIGDGYQNLVVSVDGRRLNNIDMSAQLLGAISLSDVERIEIIKGSGSVLYGDGAMAGAILIQTRQRTGGSIEGFVGSHGSAGLSASAGFDFGRVAMSATAEKSTHGGYSKKDPTGRRDESDFESWRVSLSGEPTARLRLSLDAGDSRIDTRYPQALSRAQFRDNPSQVNTGHWSGGIHTRLKSRSDYWQAGAEADIASNLVLSLRHASESKTSEFSGAFGFEYDYEHDATDLVLQYQGASVTMTGGYQVFDGRRTGSGNKTDKGSEAWFIHGQYELDDLTLSAGWRVERVDYAYRPDTGANLKSAERLSAWDLGMNYRIDEAWSAFANINSAFQSPDIDRFFLFGGGFNGFIEPAKSRTLNVGVNRVAENHRLKLVLFHARVRDEIYLDLQTWDNTNIDRSSKYGLEVQNTWFLGERYSTSLNYAWTRAIIDREDRGGGSFDGKNLPGVSRHALIASLGMKVGENGDLKLSHTWRSRAYALEDFGNNFSQKQRAYHSTDVSYQHRVANDLELFASVSNLFERSNGLWLRDDVIYPLDFTRTWRVGARMSF